MIKCDVLMFDLDGTLVDSRKDIAACTNYMLRNIGLDEQPFEVIVDYIGRGVEDLVDLALGTDNIHLKDKAVSVFRGYLAEEHEFKTVLYPGVLEILEYYSDKSIMLVTNRPLVSAKLTLERLNIDSYFDKVIGCDDISCLKPQPNMIHQALAGLAINLNRAVMVGDMDVDVMAGKNANVVTCGVAYGFYGRERLLKHDPDHIVDSIVDLKTIFN